jgi:hypothetical protein
VHAAVLVGPGGFRKPVALKILHRGAESLRREARIGGLLRHRHLVDVFEVGEVDGQWFCAMELCAGTLRARAPLSPQAVVDVGLQVCDALQYAHDTLGLVHLDLKPDNLLLTEHGDVKVADLGIAQARGFSEDGRIRGTPGYMPPEQGIGGVVDARADIYALGVTLVELATGTRNRASQTVVGWANDPAQSLETLDLSSLDTEEAPAPPPSAPVPEWLAPVVERCLEPSPVDRWPSMRALAEALAELVVAGPGLVEGLGPFAPIVAPDPGVLPLPDNAFVGRADELGEVRRGLVNGAVLALVGPAGTGKSRLALVVASEWKAGDVRYCDLSEVRELAGLCSLVARVLGVPPSSSSFVQTLGHVLGARGPVLLVLDNAEGVEGLAATLRDWAAVATDARFLVTSRLPLEHSIRMDVSPLERVVARELLVARARERGVVVEEDPDLDELSACLDGLPLALELAAGRLGVLSARDVLDRLGRGVLRTGMLGGTRRSRRRWTGAGSCCPSGDGGRLAS